MSDNEQSKSVGNKRRRPNDEAGAEATDHAESPDDCSIYVEGLPFECDEEAVTKFFDGCGEIADIRMPRWQDSGRCRGYAHIDFQEAAGAEKALERDGQYIGSRFVNVSRARSRKSAKAARAAESGASKPQPEGCKTLFVRNLPYETDEESVMHAFGRFGKVLSVRLARWNHTQRLKGFGYVEFVSPKVAGEACTRQKEVRIGGRQVSCDWETGRPRASFKTAEGRNYDKVKPKRATGAHRGEDRTERAAGGGGWGRGAGFRGGRRGRGGGPGGSFGRRGDH